MNRLRKPFSREEYLQNDLPGKILVSRFLSHSFENTKEYKDVYEILNFDEDKKCGDVKVRNKITGEILRHEVEVPASKRFQILWNRVYADLSCTSKAWYQASNGFHFLVDQFDTHQNGLPNKLIIVKIQDIIDHGSTQYRKAKNNSDKENFIHIDWKYTKFLSLNEQGTKYGIKRFSY